MGSKHPGPARVKNGNKARIPSTLSAVKRQSSTIDHHDTLGAASTLTSHPSKKNSDNGTTYKALETPEKGYDCKAAGKKEDEDLQRAEDQEFMHLFSQILEEKGRIDLQYPFMYYQSAPSDSPITNTSLTELEITSIVNNLKLRHDIGFERDLHFRPNIEEGTKGKFKLDRHRKYWSAITVEIELLEILPFAYKQIAARSGLDLQSAIQKAEKRLPKMLSTIKEILQNLLPERDVPQVNEVLEVEFLVQKIEKGVCDFIAISEWLGQLLKTHCAPMRDSMVDGMVNLMQNGDPKSISAGLCELFAVLESMKLDVANHQIRHLRPLLIEDTINYEQRYHSGRISRKKFKTESSSQWYRDVCTKFYAMPTQPETCAKLLLGTNKGFEMFVYGFIEFILQWLLWPSGTKFQLPPTFFLDNDRIRLIRSEITQEIQLQICYAVFQECYSEEMSREYRLPRGAEMPSESALKSKFRIIASEGGDMSSALPNIAVAIADEVGRLSGDPTTSRCLNLRLVEKAANLLQQQLPPHHSNDKFIAILDEFRRRLVNAVLATGIKFMTTSVWDVFNNLVPQSNPNNIPPPPPPAGAMAPTLQATLTTNSPPLFNAKLFPVRDPHTEITKKIAHIAILHWRIWAPLVYLEETCLDDTKPLTLDTSSNSRQKG